VSSGSKTRLSDENGSGATMCTVALDILRELRSATCHTAPDPASLLGGLWAATRYAVLCGHKEKDSMPTYGASPVCSQRMRACF
jgi:hypothetical protein